MRFTVKGRADAGGIVAIAWTEGVGFDDPTGKVAAMIAARDEVCATPTGSCFTAADTPGHVALLTAVSALDEVETIEGGEPFVAELQRLSALPARAVS